VTKDSEVAIPDKQVATLADLKTDDPVIVSYEEIGGVLVADRIERRSKEYIKEKQEQWERLDKMLNPNPNEPDSTE
jgi:hypothetical protein